MPLALEMSRRMLSGRGAWRIHGGGFAGTILAFVPNDMLKGYAAAMDAVVKIFTDMGMHCLFCPHSTAETLEEAAMVHGNDVDELVAKLNTVFQAK